ncbi:MAG: HEPN domain-containing protein [Planctomycetes bacterium]|nr:HEPN domain-containing protein [Planctomycetota bacterium]
MKKLTAPWVRKAESDLAAARRLARGRPPFHDQVCFHCQQGAEKYFKALLQEVGLAVPKIHDLSALLSFLLPRDPSLTGLHRGLDRLTQYAVDYRYPGFHADARKARTALRLAEHIRSEIRQRLGLKVGPARPKKSR